MAKSLRSKIKRRFRTLKRKHIEQVKGLQDKQDLHNNVQATIRGLPYRQPEKRNAFKYPSDAAAAFPQYKKQPLVDFRSASIPFSGTEFSGAYRKKIEEPVEEVPKEELEVEEENEVEEDIGEAEENVDLGAEFGRIKISAKKKRIKKSQQEKDVILLKSREVERRKKREKSQRACKKSRKVMKF